MLYAGARGETQLQLAQAQYNKDAPIPHNTALFVSQDTPLLSDFKNTIQTAFKASIFPTDFRNTEEAKGKINKWISSTTQNKIPSLIASMPPSTRLVLLSTLYFEALFQNPFPIHATKTGSFSTSQDTQVVIPFMEQTTPLPYYENALIQMCALPFQNSSIDLVLVLPKSIENQDRVIKELQEQIDDWMKEFQDRMVHIKLPKWHHHVKKSLKPALQQLGIRDAFLETADFSGINGGFDLMLSDVLHAVDFEVTEQGATAAAATAAIICTSSAVISRPSATPLYFDHPFFYFLIDRTSQEILFMGLYR